jgi:hypothetical protein
MWREPSCRRNAAGGSAGRVSVEEWGTALQPTWQLFLHRVHRKYKTVKGSDLSSHEGSVGLKREVS